MCIVPSDQSALCIVTYLHMFTVCILYCVYCVVAVLYCVYIVLCIWYCVFYVNIVYKYIVYNVYCMTHIVYTYIVFYAYCMAHIVYKYRRHRLEHVNGDERDPYTQTPQTHPSVIQMMMIREMFQSQMKQMMIQDTFQTHPSLIQMMMIQEMFNDTDEDDTRYTSNRYRWR